MTLNSEKRISFKNWVRSYKDSFPQQIFSDYIGIITPLLTSAGAGVTFNPSKKINVITFDTEETVDLTNKHTNGEWFYLPGTSNDSVTLKNTVGGTDYTETLSFNSNGELSKNLGSAFQVGDKEFKVIGLGGGLIEGGASSGYTITQTVAGIGTTSVTEGDTIVFTVNATGIDTSVNHYWTTSGTSESGDFTNTTYGSLNLVGLALTTSGIGTITRTLEANPYIENDKFHIAIRTGSQWGTIVAYGSTITINELIPEVTVGVGTTSIVEGNSIDFTLNTNNVQIGKQLYWNTLGDLSSADWTDNDPNDYVTIVGSASTIYSGIATVTRTLEADGITETGDTFWLRILDKKNGNVIGYSSTITVIDADPTATITADKSSVNEGESVVFTVNTTEMSPGGTLYFTTNGTTDANDWSDADSGSFTLDNNAVGTITRTVAGDFATTEGTENFSLTIRAGSTSGIALTTSQSISVGNIVPTVTVSVSPTTVNEGDTFTVTVNTTGLHNGATLYYSIDGTSVTPSDFNNGDSTGSFTINSSGVGSFTKTLTTDRLTEANETFKINIRSGSTTGTIVASSTDTIIADTSKTPGDNANGLTFGPVQVDRDGGNTSNTSDWYTICGIDNLPNGSSIALFIDTSGSMNMSTIQASYDLLVQKLNAKGITITSVTNPNEDWITPFLVDLP